MPGQVGHDVWALFPPALAASICPSRAQPALGSIGGGNPPRTSHRRRWPSSSTNRPAWGWLAKSSDSLRRPAARRFPPQPAVPAPPGQPSPSTWRVCERTGRRNSSKLTLCSTYAREGPLDHPGCLAPRSKLDEVVSFGFPDFGTLPHAASGCQSPRQRVSFTRREDRSAH